MIVDSAELQRFVVVYSDKKQASAKKRKSQHGGFLVVAKNAGAGAGYTLTLIDDCEKRVFREVVNDLKAHRNASEIVMKSFEIQLESCVSMVQGKENCDVFEVMGSSTVAVATTSSSSSSSSSSAASALLLQQPALQSLSSYSATLLGKKSTSSKTFAPFKPPSKLIGNEQTYKSSDKSHSVPPLSSSLSSSFTTSLSSTYGERSIDIKSRQNLSQKLSTEVGSIIPVRNHYDDTRRLATICSSFSSHTDYANEFSAALVEEILLAMCSDVKSAERLAKKALNIADSPTTAAANSSSDSRPPSVDVVCGRLRSAGLFFVTHVEAILSLRDANGDKIPSGPFSGDYVKKWKKNTDDDPTDDDKDQGRQHKVYLKFPFPIKDCPRNASESSAKGDTWLLWRPDADVFSSPDADSNRSAFDLSRAQFLQLRASKGYPFPFLNGFFFIDVWLVRSSWYV